MVATASKKTRTLVGRVLSNKMDKSIVLLVEGLTQHKLYKKTIKKFKKIHAHDENNECGLNDVVKVSEVKPISKTKTWAVVEVVEKAQ